jgi:hypothetical protein
LTTASDNDGFPAFSPRLRNLLLPDKFKPLGITKYNAKQDPIQWLRCYACRAYTPGSHGELDGFRSHQADRRLQPRRHLRLRRLGLHC